MDIYQYSDYKTYLRDFIDKNPRRGVVTELAKTAGCTHSYLSQVLHGKPELTLDHALAICEFLRLSGEEAEFFMLLVQKARANTPKLRNHCDDQLKKKRREQLELAKTVGKTSDAEISNADRDFYYANWSVPAVHILTACTDYQTVAMISERLGLAARDVEVILLWLQEKGFVKKHGAQFRHSGKNIHLPTKSTHNQLNHLNWRLRGLSTANDASMVHYTSVFAVSREDWDVLRANLLKFIEQQRELIGKSGSEEPVTFCCDLFKV